MSEVLTVEAKHIFLDIVSYTLKRSVEAQSEIIGSLNEIVKTVIASHEVSEEHCIYIPTGDGMCISLINVFKPYDVHLQIALSILGKLQEYNESQKSEPRRFQLRIGINENTDNLITDINGAQNISGAGINLASRIEGLASQSQILVGNSVYEKLVQREEHMGAFKTYDAKVKHGLILKVHQYRNDKLGYLNNDCPEEFKPKVVQNQPRKLTEYEALYLVNCIKYEKFIKDNISASYQTYIFQVMLAQLTDDTIAKLNVSLTEPNPTVKVKRPLLEHFNYLSKLDFWIQCDLACFNIDQLSKIKECFTCEECLFISDLGLERLKKEHPEICAEFEVV